MTTITPQMIENAAKAVRAHVAGRSGFRRPRPWEALPLALRDANRAEAIEALSAGLAAQRDAKKNLS
jgi:hypothetical protein